MNIYTCSRTRKSALKPNRRFTIFVTAENQTEAGKVAAQALKPKIGQAVWVVFNRVEAKP